LVSSGQLPGINQIITDFYGKSNLEKEEWLIVIKRKVRYNQAIGVKFTGRKKKT